jgi:hypothetical protein
MKNINKNLIPFFIIITFILGLSFATPVFATDLSIRTGITFTPDINSGQNWLSGTTSTSNTFIQNPIPTIYSISPNSKNLNSDTTTITVTGSNFISTSVVRFNYYDRPTTYVNSGTLQFQLNSSDVSSVGTFPVTVVNMGPGGGISNVVTFNVNKNPVVVSTTSKTNTTTASNAKKTSTVAKTTETNTTTNSDNSTTDNGLSANALFASNGFLPSSFLQWVFVFLLILFIILLWRKLYVSEEKKTTLVKYS